MLVVLFSRLSIILPSTQHLYLHSSIAHCSSLLLTLTSYYYDPVFLNPLTLDLRLRLMEQELRAQRVHASASYFS
jgi:hypothetical protein